MPRELFDAAHAAARQLGMTFSEFMVRAINDQLSADLRREARLAAGIDSLPTRATLTNGWAA
jgi:hypothetical protein